MSNLGFFLFSTCILAPALAKKQSPVVVVIGDSWGSEGYNNLQHVLREKGSDLTVVSYAVGGTTTDFWAEDPQMASNLVSDNPTAQYVWLTIGGNDVINFMPTCTRENSIETCMSTIMARMFANIKVFLDPLVADHPGIKIVQFGYDLPSLDKNLACTLFANDIIFGCNGDALCINEQFGKIQTFFVDQLEQMYPANLESINLLGSLQLKSSYPGVSLGNPDLSRWSPNEFMADCIHPTPVRTLLEPAGYDVIFESMWDVYWSQELATNASSLESIAPSAVSVGPTLQSETPSVENVAPSGSSSEEIAAPSGVPSSEQTEALTTRTTQVEEESLTQNNVRRITQSNVADESGFFEWNSVQVIILVIGFVLVVCCALMYACKRKDRKQRNRAATDQESVLPTVTSKTQMITGQ